VKAFLDDKLGPDDSGLVILMDDADWEAIENEVGFSGEELTIELTAKAEKQLAGIASIEAVIAVVREYVEIEEVNL
jgi:hypothetical protein